MRQSRIVSLVFSLLALAAMVVSCAGPAPTPISTSTPTPIPTPALTPSPLPTAIPTPTPSPTTTPPLAPAVPTLKSPLNGSLISSLNPTLEWQSSAGNASYGLQVATDQGFSNLIIDERGLNEASYLVPPSKLGYGNTYYWRVGVGIAGGKSGWSLSWSFLTPSTPSVTPTSTPTPTTTPKSTSVQIDSGLISGTIDGEVRVYKGIPFAAPPVGDLRWKPPQPVAKWAGVRECKKFGPVCPQNPPRAGSSEDCLYLNVYTLAKNTSERLPVMVFFHGGSNLVGAGSDYDGTELARQGVVIVNINYRLGPLGWLAHPLLSQESETKVSGNYGLLDQVASLQWVKTNIAAFGGDPGNVTIRGESAGASAVLSLMASPLTKGLFHQAICESGGGIATPLKEAETQGESFAAKLGISAGPDALKALRAKSADELMAASTPHVGLAASEGNYQARAVVDGWFLLDAPNNVFGAGKQQDIPLIMGVNGGEEMKYFSAIKTIASGMNLVKSKAYVYVFTRVPPGWSKVGQAAIHALELFYVFGNLDNIDGFFSKTAHVPNAEVDPVVDGRVSQNMMALWVRFAATGNPSIEGKLSWPTYNPAYEQYLDIKDPLEVKSGFSLLIK